MQIELKDEPIKVRDLKPAHFSHLLVSLPGLAGDSMCVVGRVTATPVVVSLPGFRGEHLNFLSLLRPSTLGLLVICIGSTE